MIFELVASIIFQPSVWEYSASEPEFVALKSERRIIPIAEARETPQKAQNWTPENVELLIRDKAQEYGVDAHRAVELAKCESHLIHDVQSFHVYPDGTRELSYGVFQINLPWNPDVTKEQAKDPIFNVEWTMERLAQGKWYLWSCSRILGYAK